MSATNRVRLGAMRIADMLVNQASQRLLQSLVMCMPGKGCGVADSRLDRIALGKMNAQFHRLRNKHGMVRLKMVALSELCASIDRRIAEVIAKFTRDRVTRIVLVTEALGSLADPGNTAKSAEWLARRFLEAWPGHMPAPVIFDLSLAKKSPSDASDALRAYLEAIRGENVAVVVLNDLVYAAKQQSQQLLEVFEWLDAARTDAGMTQVTIRIEVVVGYMCLVGHDRLLELVANRGALDHERGRINRLHIVVSGEFILSNDRRVHLVPGECFAQHKIPDTIEAELAIELGEIVGTVPLYRSPDTRARTDECLDRQSPAAP